MPRGAGIVKKERARLKLSGQQATRMFVVLAYHIYQMLFSDFSVSGFDSR